MAGLVGGEMDSIVVGCSKSAYNNKLTPYGVERLVISLLSVGVFIIGVINNSEALSCRLVASTISSSSKIPPLRDSLPLKVAAIIYSVDWISVKERMFISGRNI